MTSDRNDDQSEFSGKKPPREFVLRDPLEAPRRARRRRLALVIIGVITSAVIGSFIAKFLTAQWTTRRSYAQWMVDDLERLIAAQERFHDGNGRYAQQGELGVDFVPSQAVHITIAEADQTGWHAIATHSRSEESCVVTVGTGESVLRNLPSAQPTCGVP